MAYAFFSLPAGVSAAFQSRNGRSRIGAGLNDGQFA